MEERRGEEERGSGGEERIGKEWRGGEEKMEEERRGE